MADAKSKREQKSKALVNQSRQIGGLANRIIASIDPTYNDRRVLSTQDAKIQEVIDRQLDVVRGVSNTQVVDVIATIRENQRKRSGKRVRGVVDDGTELFTENIGDIYGYFKDVYKNRYLEVDDLKFISKFIPSIGEGVRLYLDIIVASDDVSQTITRKIQIPGDSDDVVRGEIMDQIERLEKEHNLLPKLKIAYRKSLITGVFYAYHISYQQLFTQYSKGLKKGMYRYKSRFNNAAGPTEPKSDRGEAPFGMVNGAKDPKGKERNVLGVAREGQLIDPMSMASSFCGTGAIEVTSMDMAPGLENFGPDVENFVHQGLITKCDLSKAMESTFQNMKATLMQDIGSSAAMESASAPEVIRPGFSSSQRMRGEQTIDRLCKSIEADLPNIYFADTCVPIQIVDDIVGIAAEGYTDFFNESKAIEDLYKKKKKEGNPGYQDTPNYADGTHDMSSGHGGDFSTITGTYIKWMDFKSMIPIEILGRTIGFYHVITTTKKRKSKYSTGGQAGEIGSVVSESSLSLFSQAGASERRKDELIQGIVDTISGAIIDQFSARFVRKNASFRNLIAECIIANGIVDNDYMIQFIPAEQVIQFKVNEDDDGKGQSILADSLFPAHQLLSITACKMLNYINKGGTKTIAHISSGKTSRNNINQVNRVIRDMQAANVTFTDMLSSGTIFSKINRDGNLAMPKDMQGNRLVEFEVQDGQNVDFNTEYENMLERWCLLGMGIPNTVIDVIGNVDVAKKVVSDNIMMAGRAASLQSDLEKPTTELYRALIDDSDMEQTLKAKAGLMEFCLPRPKILQNQNNSDAINTALQNAQSIANIYIGEDASEEDDMKLKNEFIELQVKHDVPYIDWDERDKLFMQAKINVRKKEADALKGIAEKGSSADDRTNGDTDGLPGELEDNAVPEETAENLSNEGQQEGTPETEIPNDTNPVLPEGPDVNPEIGLDMDGPEGGNPDENGGV